MLDQSIELEWIIVKVLDAREVGEDAEVKGAKVLAMRH